MPPRALTLPLVALTLACTSSETPPPAPAAPAPAAPAPTEPAAPATPPAPDFAANVKAAMDTSADPCMDFYQYSCGGWLRDTPLPADKAMWGKSFGVLRENNRALLKEILEGAAADTNGTDDRAKIGRFYASCMDEAAVNAAGTEPLQPVFAQIAAVNDVPGFMKVVGTLHRQSIRPLFGIYVGPDDKDPKRNIAHLGQGGLGLPDRDYYTDSKRAEILKGYQAHVGKMFELLGETPEAATAIAADVVAFETKLAKQHLTNVEQRDPDRVYNKLDRAGIEKLAPGLHWTAYAEGTGHPEVVDINVDSPKYLKAAAGILAKAKPETLRNYLRWHVTTARADVLSDPFVAENFAFFGKTLRGTKEIEARWKRCTSLTDGLFPHPLGRLYVERVFAGESKAIALDLIQRIEKAFDEILPTLAWMDDTTRERARGKVAAIFNKIGYPDKWRDYAGLELAGSLFANVAAARSFEVEYRVAQVGQPVDRDEWRSGPPVVNASYSGTRNEMWFPAGILQAPFFDARAPMAMNFGAIGVVMGHELTHGFDDEGRKFDATGMLREWWEPSVSKEFEKRAECVADLYSAQEVEPGLKVNGKLTLGENTADMGGVKQAFRAYQTWAAEHGGDAKPHVEGLTNQQLLFVSFAQVWCTVATPEALRVQVATDPHSPGRFRANVPVSQSPDFATAFQCAEGTPMSPKQRCEVW